MNTLQTDTNFLTGATTVGLAGAGAIVTSVDAARILAGLAGIAGGVRAEFDADVFYRHAAGIIVKAIDGERAKLRHKFGHEMQKPYDKFPIGLAVAAAIRYNNVCSLVEGLLLADTQLVLAQNPGFETLLQLLPQANLAQKILSNQLTPSQAADEIAEALSTSGAAPDTGAPSPSSATALDALTGAITSLQQQKATTAGAIAAFEASYPKAVPAAPDPGKPNASDPAVTLASYVQNVTGQLSALSKSAKALMTLRRRHRRHWHRTNCPMLAPIPRPLQPTS